MARNAHCSVIEHHLDLHRQANTEGEDLEYIYAEELANDGKSTTEERVDGRADDMGEGDESSEADNRDAPPVRAAAREITSRVTHVVGPDELSEERLLAALREEREADRAGTHPGSSASDFQTRRMQTARPKINPHTGRPTIAAQNEAEAAHRRKARKDRWGK